MSIENRKTKICSTELSFLKNPAFLQCKIMVKTTINLLSKAGFCTQNFVNHPPMCHYGLIRTHTALYLRRVGVKDSLKSILLRNLLGKFLMLCPCNTVFHLRHLFPQAFGTGCPRLPYVVVRQAFPRLSIMGYLIPFGVWIRAAWLFPFRDNRRLWDQHFCPQGRRHIRRPAFLRRVRCQAFILKHPRTAPGRLLRRCLPRPMPGILPEPAPPVRPASGRLKLHRLINLLCPFYLVHYSLTPNSASTCDCKAATCASSCSSRLGSYPERTLFSASFSAAVASRMVLPPSI